MRRLLLGLPPWSGGLLAGVMYTVSMAVFDVVGGSFSLAGSLVRGVVFTVLMTVFFAVFGSRRHAAAGLTDPVRRRQASLDSRIGAPPSDPERRAAALRLLEATRAQNRRSLRWAVPLLAVFGALSVWLAITESPWWTLNLLVPALVAAASVWEHVRDTRRVRLLREGTPGA
ncbi:hypothetical protein [Solicola sp. PLA-1-18]|uniref:hypothetical protein n=1 Tax=Solicola sp. PLA-1-18 TaxID=3380532 RepID=UPI003B7E0F66